MSSDEQPWATRLAGPHPPVVSRVAGAVLSCGLSRTQALMVAYTLADEGLLVERAGTDGGAEPGGMYATSLPPIAEPRPGVADLRAAHDSAGPVDFGS